MQSLRGEANDPSALREWMYERKREDESLTAREWAEEVEEQFRVRLSVGHVNYLLRKVELTGPRGHPYRRREEIEAVPSADSQAAESLDSKGSGLPTAKRYTEAEREYISVLSRKGDQSLSAFELLGKWEPVEGNPEHEAVDARWKDAQKAQEDPRDDLPQTRAGQIEHGRD